MVFLENQSVGVTGANGFLGSHVVSQLSKRGAIIHGYIYPGTDTKAIQSVISKSGGSIQAIDITRPETLAGKFEGIDYLFQIAGTVAEWAHPIQKIFDINFYGVRNVHFAARKAGVKRTVHTSTMSANGSCLAPYPAVTSEDAPWDLHKTGAYSVSKFLGDQVAKRFNEPGVYETIRIRPHQILGWGDTGPSAPGRLVLQAINQGFPAYIDQVTQIVHVADVAIAHVLAMERGTPGSVYNIASEHPMQVYELLRYVCKVAHVKPPRPIAIPRWLLRIAAVIMDFLASTITHQAPLMTRGNARILYKNMGTSIERAKQELGFNPRPWQVAVQDAVQWFQEEYKPVERGYDR
jgi:dihydroflavonol-4-reductase